MSSRDDTDTDADEDDAGDDTASRRDPGPSDSGIDDPVGSTTSGGSLATDEQYCPSCGDIIKQEAEICPHCGVRNRPPGGNYEKDRVTAGVLAILLGWIGVHRFYLGDTGLGVLYLCFFWTGIPALVGIIEGILYLTKTDEEFQQRYVKN